MDTQPPKRLSVEQIQNACNLLEEDLLREMLGQSVLYTAREIQEVHKEDLIKYVAQEAMAVGARDLINQLSSHNVRSWCNELEVETQDFDTGVFKNLPTLRDDLLDIIKGTPLPFIGQPPIFFHLFGQYCKIPPSPATFRSPLL